MKHTVEIIATSLEDALRAQRGGADRLEVCSALTTGGLTPSLALFEAIRQAVDLPLFVLIRPREGNFVYTDSEYQLMRADVQHFIHAGADGFVCGMNTPDGGVDVEHMTQFVKAAAGKPVTFHRAIDVCRSPLQAVDDVIATGCSRILTSGGRPVIDDAAIAMIHQMADRATKAQVSVMPGGGVNKTNITQILENQNIVEYHHSAKMRVASPLQSACFAMDYYKVDPNLVRLV